MDTTTFMVMHRITCDERRKSRSEQDYWNEVKYLDLRSFAHVRQLVDNVVSRLRCLCHRALPL